MHYSLGVTVRHTAQQLMPHDCLEEFAPRPHFSHDEVPRAVLVTTKDIGVVEASQDLELS
jgi:hypothetical protein